MWKSFKNYCYCKGLYTYYLLILIHIFARIFQNQIVYKLLLTVVNGFLLVTLWYRWHNSSFICIDLVRPLYADSCVFQTKTMTKDWVCSWDPPSLGAQPKRDETQSTSKMVVLPSPASFDGIKTNYKTKEREGE